MIARAIFILLLILSSSSAAAQDQEPRSLRPIVLTDRNGADSLYAFTTQQVRQIAKNFVYLEYSRHEAKQQAQRLDSLRSRLESREQELGEAYRRAFALADQVAAQDTVISGLKISLQVNRAHLARLEAKQKETRKSLAATVLTAIAVTVLCVITAN
jgi:septal ring factor EnvC (AmiA/AmiB activator)